jgi:phage FluMu protein Com
MKNSFIDYRCDCNKLLFKGCLLFSSIEVKCKRCGKINLFQTGEKDKKDISFSFFVDSSQKIIDGCCATSLIGTSKEKFIGKKIDFLISYLRTKKDVSFFTFLENSKNNKSEKKLNNNFLFGRVNSNNLDFN